MTQLGGFGSLAAIPKAKITDKITRRVLAGQKGMMVWWKIGAGTHIAAHSHPHEQLVWVVKDRMEFRIDKECRVRFQCFSLERDAAKLRVGAKQFGPR